MTIHVKEERRHLLGQYFTPQNVANYLWQYVKKCNPKTILEPSAGVGSLLQPLTKGEMSGIKIDAVEYAKEESDVLRNNFKSKTLNVINDNFVFWYLSNREKYYDAVLANPPYIRYQNISSEQKEAQKEILTGNGLKGNKLTNAWAVFSIAAISMLKQGGRVGLVVPNDLLQVSYAKEFRRYLLEQLSEVNIIIIKHQLFPNTSQKFVLILGEKGARTTTFRHALINTTDELPRMSELSPEPVPASSQLKWNDLLLSRHQRSLFLDKANQLSLASLTNIKLGPTTGNNSFFELTQKQVTELKAKDYVRPLLINSRNINSLVWNGNAIKKANKVKAKTYLLDLNKAELRDLPDKLKHYLKMAEENGVLHTYKLRTRKYWYRIPGISYAPLYFSRRMHTLPKLIINRAGAVSIDNYSQLTPRNDINIELLVLGLYSSMALASLELNGRLFGGGALEVLATDLDNIILPAIDYKQKIDLNSEIKQLSNLNNARDALKTAKFTDNILISRFNADYDAQMYQQTLSSLQNTRLKNRNKNM